MSQQQPQNPLIPHLVETQANALDAQKKLMNIYEAQIKVLSDALNNSRASLEATQKEADSLRSELARLKAEQNVEEKDNIVDEAAEKVEVVDE